MQRRRANRRERQAAMEPEVLGADVPQWIHTATGPGGHMPHALHDLTTEEVEGYIEGTEYAELPEPARRDGQWPRESSEDDVLIDDSRTGFEHGAARLREHWGAAALLHGEGEA
eukprot:gene4450-37039_t